MSPAHDFFERQTVKEAAVYLLHSVIHDWSDEYCIKILRQVRAAAGPNSQLVVIDCIMSYACDDPEDVKAIPGAVFPTPPAPLMRNMGQASIMPYLCDLSVSSTYSICPR